MKNDGIKEVAIDDSGRLCIFPETEKFTYIYRTATEVHWDNKDMFLYSPKPREWSYLDWYKHIINVVKNECYCNLSLTKNTLFTNIPEILKKEILAL
ncbi:hypothetical protein ACPPVU_14450 [Mucilaginibacter sp. McL0603]|uniref:hypothetical protein n=1 Tax=Mucilaginibacter sp. McL0603 TaxID=3415670 RepID=UPI003CEEBED6